MLYVVMISTYMLYYKYARWISDCSKISQSVINLVNKDSQYKTMKIRIVICRISRLESPLNANTSFIINDVILIIYHDSPDQQCNDVGLKVFHSLHFLPYALPCSNYCTVQYLYNVQ